MRKRSLHACTSAVTILVALLLCTTTQLTHADSVARFDPSGEREELSAEATPMPLSSLRVETRREEIRSEVDGDASVRHPAFEPIPTPPALFDATNGDAEADPEIPALFAMINAARAEIGLSQLRWSGSLAVAAMIHAQDMAAHDFVSHIGSDGSTCAQRVLRTGYRSSYPSEIIVWASGGAKSAFNWWWNSPVHHNMILGSGYDEMGIARVTHPLYPSNNYFVVVFARG